MENHIYSFNGTNRVQVDGMPTGLDETGSVADLFMLWWDQAFMEMLKLCDLDPDVYVRFKDDTDIIMDRLTDKHTAIYRVLDRDTIKVNENDPEFTATVISEIANKVHEMISFTFDTPERNEDQKLPILDLKVFLNDENYLVHEFYEKPSRNPRVILASSALSWTLKRTIHTQELLRRMKNNSTFLDESLKNEHLSKYLHKMKISGYTQKFRTECLLSAKNAYKILVFNHETEGKPLFRTRKEMLEAKSLRNRTSLNWWQKPINTGKPYTAVIFVPPTPGGELAKLLKKRESEINSGNEMNIRFIEKAGIKMKNILVRKDPFKATKCGVPNCPFCNPFPQIVTNEKQKCTVNNVGYRFTCQVCKFTYEGETHRKIGVRSAEHASKLKNKSAQSALWKHIQQHHPLEADNVTFKLTVTGQFFDALSRQADESQRIQDRAGRLMNSKSEFHAPKIKRISVKTLNVDDIKQA